MTYTDDVRERVHAALRSNEQMRDTTRPAIHAAILAGGEDVEAVAAMRSLLREYDVLVAQHNIFCPNGHAEVERYRQESKR